MLRFNISDLGKGSNKWPVCLATSCSREKLQQAKYFDWKYLQKSVDLKIYVTSLVHKDVVLKKQKQNVDKSKPATQEMLPRKTSSP